VRLIVADGQLEELLDADGLWEIEVVPQGKLVADVDMDWVTEDVMEFDQLWHDDTLLEPEALGVI
jgi:hypothetical protein